MTTISIATVEMMDHLRLCPRVLPVQVQVAVGLLIVSLRGQDRTRIPTTFLRLPGQVLVVLLLATMLQALSVVAV